MKTVLSLVILVCLLTPAARAAAPQTFEAALPRDSARSAATQTFEAALPRDSARSAATPESLELGVAAGFQKALQTPAQPFNSQVRVNLYGNVTLRGSAFILAPSPFGISVPMSGQGSFASGIVQTGYVTINHTEQVRLYPNQNYVSQFAQIQANVPLYCRGQYAGTGMVSGSFMVTGFKSGNYLSLQGSGPLTGNAFVNCPDQKAASAEPRSPGLPGHAVEQQPKQ